MGIILYSNEELEYGDPFASTHVQGRVKYYMSGARRSGLQIRLTNALSPR